MNKIESIVDRHGYVLAFSILGIGLFLVILFAFIEPFNHWTFEADANLFSAYGDFIGGLIGTLFSVVAIILLYRTLITQKRALEKQEIQISNQQEFRDQQIFESSFFNLLDSHQNIINDINGKFFYLKNNHLSTTVINTKGRDFFIYAKYEIGKIWFSLCREKFLGNFRSEDLQETKRTIDSFYNSGSDNFMHPDDAKEEEKKLKKKQRYKYANKVYKIKENDWEAFHNKETPGKLSLIYSIFFEKYHHSIGHYFRHLYHILNFIIDTTSGREKINEETRKYINFVQSQMSSYELLLLYYNSFCFPNMMEIIKKVDFLENLSEEDLIVEEHYCDSEIKMKSRSDLVQNYRD